MKRIILKTLFTLLVFPLSAQTWFPIGAKWYYNNDESIFFTPYIKRYGYYKYEVERDTLVSTLSAKVISRKEVSYDGSIGATTELIYREENQKVYFWNNTEYIQLYDLNLQKSDVLGNWFNYQALECDSVGKFIVDSIYDHPYNNSFRVQQLNLKTYYQNNDIEDNVFSVIEKVGANAWDDFENHLFFPPTIYCRVTGDITDNSLRCYMDGVDTLLNAWNYYNDGWPCDTLIDLTVSTHHLSKNTLQISPNPTSETLTISNLDGSNNVLNIYSSTGELIKSAVVSGSSYDVNVSDLPTGVYYLTVISQEGKQSSGSFVKE